MKKYLLVVLIVTFSTLFVGCLMGNASSKDKEMTSYELYYPDEQAESFLTQELVSTTECLNENIMKEMKQREILRENISLLSVDKKDDEIILNFSNEFLVQLCQQGTCGENVIIGSLVNTFLNAYDVENVRILVENESFESGHREYVSSLTWFE